MSKRKNREGFGDNGEFIPLEDSDDNQESVEIRENIILPNKAIVKNVDNTTVSTVNIDKKIEHNISTTTSNTKDLKRKKRLKNIKPVDGIHFH